MAFKSAFVVMAPDAEPERHRASIKTDKADVTLVMVPLMDFTKAAAVCKDLVEKNGVQSLVLCPGFTAAGVAKVMEAVGEGVPINVARGDVPSVMATAGILANEGWF